MKKISIFLVILLSFILFMSGCGDGEHYSPSYMEDMNIVIAGQCKDNHKNNQHIECQDAFHSTDTYLINETYDCVIFENITTNSQGVEIEANDEYFFVNDFHFEYTCNYAHNHWYFEITFIKYATKEPIDINVISIKSGEIIQTIQVYVR